jgi:hypothetical protein
LFGKRVITGRETLIRELALRQAWFGPALDFGTRFEAAGGNATGQQSRQTTMAVRRTTARLLDLNQDRRLRFW